MGPEHVIYPFEILNVYSLLWPQVIVRSAGKLISIINIRREALFLTLNSKSRLIYSPFVLLTEVFVSSSLSATYV